MSMNPPFAGVFLPQINPPSTEPQDIEIELLAEEEPITTEMKAYTDLPRITPAFREHRLNWLSGSSIDLASKYQLLLLIQPNCPGCVANAIPVANAIASAQNNDFDTYCVSTAFEDFDHNHVFGAKALLDGTLAGKTAARLGPSTTVVPTMPYAHDHIVDRDEADSDFKEWALQTMLESARNQLRALNTPEHLIEHKLASVGYDALPEKLAELFWTVKCEGSPTWVIHKSNGEVMDVRFGYLDEKDIRKWVGRLVPTNFAV